MRIAWLLLTRSSKGSWGRLALVAAAISLGMLMILTFMAGLHALEMRTSHSNWRADLYNRSISGQPIDGISPLKTKIASQGNLIMWQNEAIVTVSLRATNDTSPEIPGLSTPKEGEYYVSQGLNEVIRAHPEAHLGDRFGTKQIGIIPDDLSSSPDGLEVVRGMSSQEADQVGVGDIYQFTGKGGVSRYSGVIGVVLTFGASLLLFPIVMFLAIATQLGSAQREKRYAALRLIGATQRQITYIMAVESLSAALAGIVIGSLAYLAILPLLASYRFGGERFWQGDLTVPVSQYIVAVCLALTFCFIANWWGVRRARLSPLGVVREQSTGKRPRAWRLLLFIPGIAMFIWMALPQGQEWFKMNAAENSIPLMLVMVGIVCVMLGLILAGPWLTYTIARLVAHRTQSATTLLATRRIAVQSKQIFRSVSGVVLALFAGSFYLTAVSGVAVLNVAAVRDNGYSQLKPGTAIIMSTALPDKFDDQLKKQTFVETVANGYSVAGITIMPCTATDVYTSVVCPEHTAFIGIAFDKPTYQEKWFGESSSDIEQQVRQNTELMSTSDPQPVASYLLRLDSNDSIDKLRSYVAHIAGLDSETYIVSGTYAQEPVLNPITTELAGLAYVGMTITLLVAIASLVISTIGGLLERRRSFVTLRLGGMAIGQMKRTVMIEALIPLISVSLVAAGLGVWIGSVFITATSSTVRPVLNPLYFLIVGGSLFVAILAIYSILPTLNKITRPEENQTE